MIYQPLSDSTVKNILAYLGCKVYSTSYSNLNRLIYAYIRKVPWESVSRIIKRQTTASTTECPRWPEEFWHDAMEHGFGGTCFESSLAFYSLLTALGYQGYLTVNDMGSSQACHAAIIIIIHGSKFLVDITIPVHGAIKISPRKILEHKTPFHHYWMIPLRENVYEVERSHHPQRNAFTLIDIPVNLSDYLTIVENDYTHTGHFLRSVVISKIIENKFWRFFSDHKPYRLECFDQQGKHEMFLPSTALPHVLAEKFHMPEDSITAALLGISVSVTLPEIAQMKTAIAVALSSA